LVGAFPMLIPFSPYAPALLSWSRRLGDGANASLSPLPGPEALSRVRRLRGGPGSTPGCCLSAPGDGVSLVRGGRFLLWDAEGRLVRETDLAGIWSTPPDSWGPALWLAGGRCALVCPGRILLMETDGHARPLGSGADVEYHTTFGLAASADGRLLAFSGAGELHVHFHPDEMALRLSFRRDGHHIAAGPPLHPPTVYKDGRMVLQHELGCLCCSALGEVEWWFPGGELSHPPVLNRDEECGFQDAAGRTVFVDRQGTPLSEMGEPLLLAAKPRGGWLGLGGEALYSLDRNYDLHWRLPVDSAGLPPVVDARGWVWVVDQTEGLLQVSPQGRVTHRLTLPGRPGLLALSSRGRLSLDLGDEAWLIG